MEPLELFNMYMGFIIVLAELEVDLENKLLTLLEVI